MFIKTLSQYIDGYDLSITIRKNEDGTITAIMVPKLNSEKKAQPFAPLSMTADPDYFDSIEFMNSFKPAMAVTKEKLTNIKLYTDALDKAEKKKKDEIEKKNPSSSKSSAKKDAPGTVTSKTTKQVPNPEYIAPEERNEENEDYDPDTYDEETPEFITEEVEEKVQIQKTLI